MEYREKRGTDFSDLFWTKDLHAVYWLDDFDIFQPKLQMHFVIFIQGQHWLQYKWWYSFTRNQMPCLTRWMWPIFLFFLLCVLLFHTNSNIFVNVFYVHLPLSCVAHYVAHTFADMDRERERERVNEKNEDLLGAVFTPIVISFGLLLFTFFFHPRCI